MPHVVLVWTIHDMIGMFFVGLLLLLGLVIGALSLFGMLDRKWRKK